VRAAIEDQVLTRRGKLAGRDFVECGSQVRSEAAGGAELFDLQRARRGQQHRKQN
jgi:hypothetical protein